MPSPHNIYNNATDINNTALTTEHLRRISLKNNDMHRKQRRGNWVLSNSATGNSNDNCRWVGAGPRGIFRAVQDDSHLVRLIKTSKGSGRELHSDYLGHTSGPPGDT